MEASPGALSMCCRIACPVARCGMPGMMVYSAAYHGRIAMHAMQFPQQHHNRQGGGIGNCTADKVRVLVTMTVQSCRWPESRRKSQWRLLRVAAHQVLSAAV